MGHLAIVGGGVIGLLSAFAALKQGLGVTVIDPDMSSNISWSGSRIVRDDPNGQTSSNACAWQEVLRMIDYGPVSSSQLHHITGDTITVEKGAFVVNTARVQHKLLRRLELYGGFSRLTDNPAVHVSRCGHVIQLDGGGIIEADAVIVAAGKGGRALCPSAAAQINILHQVFVNFTNPDAYGVAHTFIQHDGDRGLWGMPQVGGQAAKISASNLCFATAEGAAQFMASGEAKIAFLRRAKALYPAQYSTMVSWVCQSYAASRRTQPHRAGAAIFHLACNGGDFKRAPLIATRLLQHATQL